MKKKVVSWLLAAAMVWTCVPMNTYASDFDVEDVFVEAAAEGAEAAVEEMIEDSAVEISEESVSEEESADAASGQEEAEAVDSTEDQDAENTEPEIPEAAESVEEEMEETEEIALDDFADLALAAEEGEAIEGYVLMNIPYDDFYKAEKSVDVVSAATSKKRANTNLAGGSYHVGADGSDITGIVFPVKVGDIDLTKDTKYTKAENAEALFENVSYAYTSAAKEPSVYKELHADGTFGPVQGTRTTVDAKVSLKLTDKHADYVLEVEDLKLGDTENVSAVLLETSDGSTYGLRHVNNIWKKTELGWNKSDASYASLTGKTVSKVTYITTEGIYEIKADVAIQDIVYVLMNIPYDKFYAKELASGSAAVDAVSSATKNKPRTGGLAGSSYHVSADGSDITGIVYPVKVNPEELKDKNQITDEAKVEITVTNRGQTSTTTYAGKDALFEAPSYSYYVLTDKPKAYKVLENGSFSAVKGLKAKDTASLTENATATLKEVPGHADYEISISGFILPEGENLSAAILTTEDGSTYGLRHVTNIWRNGLELGWNAGESGFDGLIGKTITKITYITQNGLYEMNVNVPTESFRYVLMNIPYAEFYSAELAEGSASVDAVSSATKNKPRTGGLAGGSYHVNADGSDITGVIYPVRINTSALEGLKQITDQDSVDITVTNRGQTTTTTYAGKDALFEAPSYSYYVLSEKPARYKTALVSDGKLTFTAVNGRAAAATVETELATAGRHAFYELSLKDIEFTENISAVYLTDEDGKTYGLRHIANIWRGTELGWQPDELPLSGKTITKITYLTQSGKTEYTVNVKVPVYYEGSVTGKLAETLDSVSLAGLPQDIGNAKVTIYNSPARNEYVYVAQDAAINDDKVALSEKAAADTVYTVQIASDNYANIVTTVQLIDLSKGSIELSEKSYAFDGKAKTPDVSVTLNGETVSADHYTVAYKDNVEAGKASVTVTGKDGYVNSLTASFKITKNTAALKSQLNAGLSASISGSALKLAWGKVSGADGYEIYVVQCGNNFPSKATKTIKSGSTTSLKLTKLGGKKIDPAQYYKMKVYAYRMVNGKKTRIAAGLGLHVAGGNNKTYTNAKKVTAKKSTYSVKVNKPVKVSAAVTKADQKKSLFKKSHVSPLRYWSTDAGIAKVDTNGKVTGVKKGTCYVYAIAANGAKKKIKINVK